VPPAARELYLHHPFCSLRSAAWCKRIFLSAPPRIGDVSYSFGSALRKSSRDATALGDVSRLFRPSLRAESCDSLQTRREGNASPHFFTFSARRAHRLTHGRRLAPSSASYAFESTNHGSSNIAGRKYLTEMSREMTRHDARYFRRGIIHRQ